MGTTKQCNCITTTDELTRKNLIKKNKGKVYVLEGNGLDVALGMSGSRTYTNYDYKTTKPKKNGDPGPVRKRIIMIVHTFCPFCGKKYPTN